VGLRVQVVPNSVGYILLQVIRVLAYPHDALFGAFALRVLAVPYPNNQAPALRIRHRRHGFRDTRALLVLALALRDFLLEFETGLLLVSLGDELFQ